MVFSDIKKGLNQFVERYDSQTYLGSYRETSRSSLLNEGLSTRANSLWKMAEYVVAQYDNNTSASINDYISGWKTLASNANNQYLIIEENKSVWAMYDAKGNRLGGEEFIQEYFSKMKNSGLKKTSLGDTSVHQYPLQQIFYGVPNKNKFLPYLTALRTKPFMLLAGISGTGKSRIVRELAKACWKEGDEEFGKNHPRNYCMVQVKPNWHDSSELIGYVSRINGEKYVIGPFLRFLAKAIKDENTPYFLCLDEMNLAPVEQYFAEYLSVIESRKLNADGSITTDPIIPFEDTEAYGTLIDQLFDTEADRIAYKSKDGKRLTIPQNLFVIGTVNMDETTFSFSRKVLDRAMTIEMNEVDLRGGLEKGKDNEIGYIGNSIIGDAAEGCDVYEENKDLCDQVLDYLKKVNTVLEGTPFKIAYRTRNEFLLYAVNRQLLDEKSQLWQTLDEMTSMKILSRIEGDGDRTQKVLEGLKTLVDSEIVANIPEAEDNKEKAKSITAAKIEEMLKKLKESGYTSYWT